MFISQSVHTLDAKNRVFIPKRFQTGLRRDEDTGHRIARWEGMLFLAYYVAYVTYVVLDATGHAGASGVRNAVLFFALPLTVVTLVVVAGQAAWFGNPKARTD